ncbi:DUF892 family protein [Chryseobacterium sp. NRRL B-14798]|uniref:YciE/YciF ferroxidase family protein n=1 Tax=Chryseobacterium sp. NRRL B-14798 TaxID=3162880 RepID=UPI003D195A3E
METKTATKKTPAKKATPAKAKTPAKKNAAKSLEDLFEDALKDIYWAEKALLKALPAMMKNATSEKLKQGIDKHITETEGHVMSRKCISSCRRLKNFLVCLKRESFLHMVNRPIILIIPTV